MTIWESVLCHRSPFLRRRRRDRSQGGLSDARCCKVQTRRRALSSWIGIAIADVHRENRRETGRRRPRCSKWRDAMSTILLVILILILIGALPTWPYSSGWGYYSSCGAGLIVIILIVLLLAGRV